MPRLKLVLSYDGTQYCGWQRQRNGLSIQEVVERDLSKISNQRVLILSSGRTDAGVHARVQVVHCDLPERWKDTSRLQSSLNSLLPKDIRVLAAETVSDTFHALKNAKRKMYVYFIHESKVHHPAFDRYCWNLRRPVSWSDVEVATQDLIGTHDFSAFAASGRSARTSVRTIYEAQWGVVQMPAFGFGVDLRFFKIVGNGFLKHMVRTIVGTLVWMGSGKADWKVVRRALESKDRSGAGPTAPPHGLWLWDVDYSLTPKIKVDMNARL